MKYQIWLKDGRYAMVSGVNCDSPLLLRESKKVHEFDVGSRELAEHIKERFIRHHEARTRK